MHEPVMGGGYYAWASAPSLWYATDCNHINTTGMYPIKQLVYTRFCLGECPETEFEAARPYLGGDVSLLEWGRPDSAGDR